MSSKVDFFSSNDDIARLLSLRIKQERIAQELKQSELADMANVKVHVIRNLEQHSKVTLDIFNDMFDFNKERIELDAFNYINEQSKKARQRVKSAK